METAPTQSKMHTWIIVLLVWVIALLIFLAGYMIYRDQTRSATDVTTETSCSEEIADAMKAYEDGKEEDATETPTCPTTDTYSGGFASFNYPINWEVVMDEVVEGSVQMVRISKEPLSLCLGCDGPGNPINVEIYSNSKDETLDAYVARRYTAANGYTNTTKGTMTTTDGTTVLRVKGQFSGLYSGAFEDIVHVTDTYIIVLSNDDTGIEANDDAWNTIKSSYGFWDTY